MLLSNLKFLLTLVLAAIPAAMLVSAVALMIHAIVEKVRFERDKFF